MERFLLDTHVVLWIGIDPSQISAKAKAILDSDADKYVSIASAWEVAIKLGKNKPDNMVLDLPGELPEFYRMLDINELVTIPVLRPYLLHIPTLPPLHKDPFDRLIISTAMAEEMTIITADINIQKYDVPWIW
jgi:PIN domain nuclease of toxin-antitoxin system